MATKILGKVAITPKGDYNNATTYQNLDLVTYEGGSYLALKETKGNLPTNNEYWQLVAEKGRDGEPGTPGTNGIDGKIPVKGTDYYTEADKQEMVNLVLNALPSAEGVEF